MARCGLNREVRCALENCQEGYSLLDLMEQKKVSRLILKHKVFENITVSQT